MKAAYIEIAGSGERRCIEKPLWITTNRNGVLATPHAVKALGIGDGKENIWSLGELKGYPEARLITRAEYEETLTPPESDPELTEAEALAIMMGGSYETE